MKTADFSPTGLAYLGDSVYETAVRAALVRECDRPLKDYNAAALALVTAKAQCRASKLITPMLTPDEADVMRRGRNAHCGSVPKSATAEEYHAATGLEALFGCLYLSGRADRIDELSRFIIEAMTKA